MLLPNYLFPLTKEVSGSDGKLANSDVNFAFMIFDLRLSFILERPGF